MNACHNDSVNIARGEWNNEYHVIASSGGMSFYTPAEHISRQALRQLEMAQLAAMNGKPKPARAERPRLNGRIRTGLRMRQKAGRR